MAYSPLIHSLDALKCQAILLKGVAEIMYCLI